MMKFKKSEINLLLIFLLVMVLTSSCHIENKKPNQPKEEKLNNTTALLTSVDINKVKNDNIGIETWHWESSEYPGKKILGAQITDRDKLYGALHSDVFKYFSLENKYKTDLEREVYLESQDYRAKKEYMNGIKDRYTNYRYYLEWNLNAYYDSDFNSFITEIIHSTRSVSSEKIRFAGDLYIIPPTGINVFQGNEYYDTSRPLPSQYPSEVSQKIYFKVENNRHALKIEQNMKDVKILIVFKFLPDKSFEGVAERVYLYNELTKEVYQVY